MEWFDAQHLQFGCIGFVKTKMKSSAAERYCVSKGYRLVEIYNQNQQDFLVEKCNEIDPARNHDGGFWIGLKRTQGTKIWKWLDSDVKPDFTAWGNSNPNNGMSELLAAIYKSYGYKWVDFDKQDYYNDTPICQKMSKKYQNDCSCLKEQDLEIDWFDAKHLQLGCIGFVKIEMKSPEAEKYCASRGYRLVEIYNQNQQDYIVDKCTDIGHRRIGNVDQSPRNVEPTEARILRRRGSCFWIGLKRTIGTSTWKWLDSGVTPEFTAWDSGSGQPNNGNGGLLANAHKFHGYKWGDFNQYHKFENCKPICQKLN